jgi:hypothetical protein
LAAVVFHHAIAVVAAVVFDCQAVFPIQEVGTTYEAAARVVDGNLDLRPRKSGIYEQHT